MTEPVCAEIEVRLKYEGEFPYERGFSFSVPVATMWKLAAGAKTPVVCFGSDAQPPQSDWHRREVERLKAALEYLESSRCVDVEKLRCVAHLARTSGYDVRGASQEVLNNDGL